MGHTKCVQNVMLVSQNARFGSKWGLIIRTTCVSVGFNCFKPFYTQNLFILLNVLLHFKYVTLSEVSSDIVEDLLRMSLQEVVRMSERSFQ